MPIGATIIAVTAIALIVTTLTGGAAARPAIPGAPSPVTVPHRPGAYLGIFTPLAPNSYAGVTAFSAATGVKVGLVSYYSGWREPFQARFAATVAGHHAVTLVQIDPTGVSLEAIASGHYDDYLRTYALAVKAFGARVVLSFGHEMNGHWYSWGYRHVSPAVFVAAWRHIVNVFRQQAVRNVTWMWTVNVINRHAGIPSPAPWWPGSSYVNWVGMDGYYDRPFWKFAPLFGPTIKAVRKLTLDPVLISETSVAREVGQPAKIADLFAGIRAYGLLGVVWFNANKARDWRLSSPAAFAAFRRGAQLLKRPAP